MNIGSFVCKLFKECNNDIQTLRSNLYSDNIKSVCENKENPRIIMHSDRYSSVLGIQSDLINGLIVEIDTGKILCVPQKRFQYVGNKTFKTVNTGIKNNQYIIYKLNDGTTINLYWRDKWIISTVRGMEMNDVIWMGPLSYENVLHVLLKQYPFSWDKLDKQKTYTIGFNHPNFHPFENRGKLWFIQSTNNSTLEVNITEDIGIPVQELYESKSSETLQKLCNIALDEYLNQRDVCFGFTLIHRNDDKHLMMESTLFKKIKSIMYSGNYKIIVDNNYDRLLYIILKSYLDPAINTENSTFLQLFPQFSSIFKIFDKKIASITATLALCFLDSANTKIENYNSPSVEHLLINKLYQHLLMIFNRPGAPRKFSSRRAVKLEIIKYIIDLSLVSYYYPMFGKIMREMLA